MKTRIIERNTTRSKKNTFKEALKKSGYGALSATTISNKILIINPQK